MEQKEELNVLPQVQKQLANNKKSQKRNQPKEQEGQVIQVNPAAAPAAAASAAAATPVMGKKRSHPQTPRAPKKQAEPPRQVLKLTMNLPPPPTPLSAIAAAKERDLRHQYNGTMVARSPLLAALGIPQPPTKAYNPTKKSFQGPMSALLQKKMIDHNPGNMDVDVTKTPPTDAPPRHPLGHRERYFRDVWDVLETNQFLPLCDTYQLSDLYFQPVVVIPDPNGGNMLCVYLIHILFGAEIRFMKSYCKMNEDEVFKVLYLNTIIINEIENKKTKDFMTWINEIQEEAIKCYGEQISPSIDGIAMVCNYVLQNQPSFTFYPPKLNGKFGIFFKKVTYHSYVPKPGEPLPLKPKLPNPTEIKCSANGKSGTFEYMFQARILLLPDKWIETVVNEETTATDGGEMEILPEDINQIQQPECAPPTSSVDGDDEDDDNEQNKYSEDIDVVFPNAYNPRTEEESQIASQPF